LFAWSTETRDCRTDSWHSENRRTGETTGGNFWIALTEVGRLLVDAWEAVALAPWIVRLDWGRLVEAPLAALCFIGLY